MFLTGKTRLQIDESLKHYNQLQNVSNSSSKDTSAVDNDRDSFNVNLGKDYITQLWATFMLIRSRASVPRLWRTSVFTRGMVTTTATCSTASSGSS